MTTFFSEKLRVVSFLSILVVFYIHAGSSDVYLSGLSVPFAVRACLSGMFGPCAVPMFFTISGYLFFRNANVLGDVFRKMVKRVRTLLVPFVIAAVLYPLQPVLKELLTGVPSSVDYVGLFREQNFVKTLMCLFVDSGRAMPWAYHLWFLRDLLIIVALSPCVWYVRKKAGLWSIAVALALYFLFPRYSFLFGLYFFVAGSLLLHRLSELSRRWVYVLVAAFLSFAVFRQIYGSVLWPYLRVAEVSLGVSALWCVYDLVVSRRFRLASCPVLRLCCPFTFFLYLYHEPLLQTVLKGISGVLGGGWPAHALSYLFTPFVVAALLVGVGWLFRKYAPAVYGIMVGGR